MADYRQGRLRKLTEQSGTDGANVITSYGYDVGNRLARVCASPSAQLCRLRIAWYASGIPILPLAALASPLFLLAALVPAGILNLQASKIRCRTCGAPVMQGKWIFTVPDHCPSCHAKLT